ncbi:MAG: arginine--tRNA ligase [Bernardetiaceae bacterium]|nr:arginine--tRNA ligase [Bernardetiaceae bacterium]
MSLELQIQKALAEAFKATFDLDMEQEKLVLQPTRKEFVGTHTFVTFPYGKLTQKNPQQTAELLGHYLKDSHSLIADFQVVKGFLNLSLKPSAWVSWLAQRTVGEWQKLPLRGEKAMIEYSSPNTNKPLHLGHLRNNFLGFAVAQILEAAGFEVCKANLINDRGIHICKSMVAYRQFGNGETPEQSGKKGDHLIGDYYVKFNEVYKSQIQTLIAEGNTEKEAEQNAPIMQEAREMLLAWEAGDAQVVALWKKLNSWVYEGFEKTYKDIGVSFDTYYYESETYLLGKEIVEEGLKKGVFFRKEEGSVWADLKAEKLDEKLLLRGDGTSVYMTQDMGTADLKYKDFPMQHSIYVVGNEQDYHFKVLKVLMQKMGRAYADGIFHLSYGMVELPEGKMKSREGTVVDADELLAEMIQIAKNRTEELGKIENFSVQEAEQLYRQLALGALKYYLLRVEPKKKMLFNPEDSIDFQGNSGVYLQYTHAKISAILRKAERDNIAYDAEAYAAVSEFEASESELFYLLSQYENTLREAADSYSPAVMANYMYELARAYGKMYADLPIFPESDAAKKAMRIALSAHTGEVLRAVARLLGIEMPEQM